MHVTLHVPAHRAGGQDHPEQSVDLEVESLPQEGNQISMINGIVEVATVRHNPMWRYDGTQSTTDTHVSIDIFTNWVRRPGSR